MTKYYGPRIRRDRIKARCISLAEAKAMGLHSVTIARPLSEELWIDSVLCEIDKDRNPAIVWDDRNQDPRIAVYARRPSTWKKCKIENNPRKRKQRKQSNAETDDDV